MRVFKRSRFLLDLAEELNWLNDKAGTHIAAAWYRSLKETLHQLQRHPFLGRERKTSPLPASEPGALTTTHAGSSFTALIRTATSSFIVSARGQ